MTRISRRLSPTAGPAFILLIFSLAVSTGLIAQTNTSTDSTLSEVTLQTAVDYAIKHQPTIQQSLIDQQLTETQIRSRLADWYPQVNFAYNLQHNFELPTNVIAGNPIKAGLYNTSSGQFLVSQAIFNRDVLLASRTKNDVRLQSRQETIDQKIDLNVTVTKAFYDVLATTQQLKVSDENIVRIERSLKDAFAQYQQGVVDKTDYKRATISLNNAKALKKTNQENLQAKLEYLKYVMGYPVSGSLNIVYDSLQMEKEIALDTLQFPDYTSRIEYRQLETQRRLLEADVKYNRWSYLPSVAANGAYNLNFQNNDFGKLYNTNYPNSYAALTLAFPIFQGGKRKANIEAAELQLKRNDFDILSLKNAINSQYSTAIADYKGSLANYLSLKENLSLAQEVYDVIQLQYRSGIKTYLEVITAETDLRSAEINYYDALYELLASKVDVQRALGQINY